MHPIPWFSKEELKVPSLPAMGLYRPGNFPSRNEDAHFVCSGGERIGGAVAIACLSVNYQRSKATRAIPAHHRRATQSELQCILYSISAYL
jgi:hypothetical protein